MKEQPVVSPYLALFIATLAVSTSAILVKLSAAPASIIATYRLLFTVLFMLPFVLWKHLKEIRLISKRDWIFSTLAGVFLALHFILWFESLNYTSVASSVVLVTLQPLFSFIGAYLFFKERVALAGIAGGLLAVAGSVFIGWSDFRLGGTALFGDVLALLGAATVTGYWLFGQSVRKRLSLMMYTFVVYTISTIVLLIYDMALGFALFPYSSQDWLVFIGLAIFPTLLGHTIFNWTIKWISANTVSMAILGEPIGAAILAYFILSEKITAAQTIGTAVILCGIYLFMRFNRPSNARRETGKSGTWAG
ncbi:MULTISPECIES: DMT family transporter [Aneurinibacillus]|jgi:drug/metabolite transporter (DMT)-like permease|uniref:Membrane protein n=1 Tax=Aneurinibacillus danicus TaxID=267746 RepID=A0A511V131_9BACL|nr:MULTISPECIES: DMT family transporter [Aneurinibacillus]GEN32626.1 membrane protein [Aneurinibacillus danicus]